MSTLVRDLRLALRMLRKDLGVTCLSVLSIGLGIGAATAIFSVVNAVLFEPFPYKGFDRMFSFRIEPLKKGARIFSYSMTEYLAIREQNRVFEDVFAMGFESLRLTGGTEPEFVGGKLFSGNAFDFLGVKPLLGRTFQPDDYGPGGTPKPVIVLSYLLWQRRFAGDPGVLGREVRLNGRNHTVIGVMPRRFTFYTNPGQPALWLPLAENRAQERSVVVYGRLKPGVSAERASNELHAIFSAIAEGNPDRFPEQGFAVVMLPFTRFVRDWIRSMVYVLMAATGFLLLIACANVANLLLARASTRTKEMAVRVSVGALRRDLLRQLLSESVLLSLAGGLLGIMLAYGGTNALLTLMPQNALPSETNIQISTAVLLFSFGISVLTGILCGLIPALHASKLNLNKTLKDAGRGSPSGLRGNRTRNVLVVSATAFSMILLVGAGLMIQTFASLTRETLGFQTKNILTMQIPLGEDQYPDFDQRAGFYRNVLERVQALPGVASAALANGLPPRTWSTTSVEIEGRVGTEELQAGFHLVSSDYFRTMGMLLLRGRAISKEDTYRSQRVAVVNQTMVSRFFPDGMDPIGRRIRLAVLERQSPWTMLPSNPDAWVTVVGVAADAKNDGLREQPRPGVFVPFTLLGQSFPSLAIRTVSEPYALLKAVQYEIHAIDGDQPVTRVSTMQEQIENETAGERFTMVLLSVFAAVGLVLAATGIYGVMSYTVSQQVHEIGIRMALGAQTGDVIRLVLLRGAKLVFLGITAGAIGSVALTRLIESQLHGVEPMDPLAFGTVAIILVAVALLACYIPARRAAAVDPLVALRYE